MSKKNTKKLFLLKIQLTSAIFLLVIALISGFFVFGPELSQIAKALTGNYNKGATDELIADDWNNLDDDFLDKSGDTMTGPLVLPADPTTSMQATTKQYVDNMVSGSITNTSGNSLRMVCGRTYLIAGPVSSGGNCWIYETTPPDSDNFLAVLIDTSAAGFTVPPQYFASLGGSYNFSVFGVNDITSWSNRFSVRLFYLGVNRDGILPTAYWTYSHYITDQQAEDWGWYIDWCGVGQ